MTKVTREQPRIIRLVDMWRLEFRHVLLLEVQLSDHCRTDDDFRSPVTARPVRLLIPDCRQEPLYYSLSLAEIQQRYSLVWEMCLILRAKKL